MGFNKTSNSEVLSISSVPTEVNPLEATPAKTSEVAPSSEKNSEETKN